MIFVYKFTNFARCSSALEDDLGMVDNIIDSPIKITRSVAWSYFNHVCDPNLDLNEHFQDQAKENLIMFFLNLIQKISVWIISIQYSSVL